MDDLSGLNWDAAPQKPKPNYNILSIRSQTPPSDPHQRQPTPLSSTLSGNSSKPVSKASINDSFSNLISTSSSRPTASLSLQERQKQLLEQQSRKAVQQTQKNELQFNANDAQFWDEMESRSSTPALPTSSVSSLPVQGDYTNATSTDEDDILAAFNASAPVDSSSHYPPPQASNDLLQPHIQGTASARRTPSPAPSSNGFSAQEEYGTEDDDDPFGLGQMEQPSRAARAPKPALDDTQEDDILGDLGRPVSEFEAQRNAQRAASQGRSDTELPGSGMMEPRDRAIAELVEMGFSPDQARDALVQTSSGTDVQEAVGILLNQAHQQSRNKSKAASSSRDGSRDAAPRTTRSAPSDEAVPTWMRQKKDGRGESRSPAPPGTEGVVEKDVTQVASQFSQTVFRQANFLWKSGQKRIQKVIAEYQHEGESSQPRWMREPHPDSQEPVAEPTAQPQSKGDDVTDEALLLETGRAKPQRESGRRRSSASRSSNGVAAHPASQEKTSYAPQRPPQRSQVPQSGPTKPERRPQERLTKQAIEEQTSQAYVSPARRRKPPATTKPVEAEPSLDIFSSTEKPPSPIRAPAPAPSQSSSSRSVATPPRSTTPLQVRPKAPPRDIPSVSASALSTSNTARQKGGEAFKRGDYAEAHSHYTTALTSLPPTHPLTITLHTNRALTALKTGDPKSAIADSDAALALIGPSRGDGESIPPSGDPAEPAKPMRDLFAKALTRKAEALEHMEKWPDAAAVWRDAVQAGVGGAVAIAGRNRCEKAAGLSAPAPAPTPRKKPPAPSALAQLNGAGEAEAVKRLRAAEAAAAAASDEAFALSDTVDARLTAWKAGKEGNLRALLASLDGVLWAGAGWSKVGMGDLVLPGRVKVVYMKAIAKCHPDKIPQSATTEQRMISASVFATLNEAWDKFKKDNGL